MVDEDDEISNGVATNNLLFSCEILLISNLLIIIIQNCIIINCIFIFGDPIYPHYCYFLLR